MNIKHSPILDTKRVCELYSEKDGVEVKYVCTSAIGSESSAGDIFFRETPHPEFGNRYFSLTHNGKNLMIGNADKIEEAEFGMVEGPNGWEYSQHRHDYRQVGNCAVDGGRAYFKRVGDLSAPVKYMKIVNGKFV